MLNMIRHGARKIFAGECTGALDVNLNIEEVLKAGEKKKLSKTTSPLLSQPRAQTSNKKKIKFIDTICQAHSYQYTPPMKTKSACVFFILKLSQKKFIFRRRFARMATETSSESESGNLSTNQLMLKDQRSRANSQTTCLIYNNNNSTVLNKAHEKTVTIPAFWQATVPKRLLSRFQFDDEEFSAKGLLISDRGYLEVYPYDKLQAKRQRSCKWMKISMNTKVPAPKADLNLKDSMAYLEKYYKSSSAATAISFFTKSEKLTQNSRPLLLTMLSHKENDAIVI
ncbi:Oidioi.mRNA.OKI2018_I69.chr2.g7400.t1.cds [Oikopleura dioica]|uniref:Oidioi.mRNA.OKI2018_I69.chr2.g7400.t1.cds n=1 Tax=Oikopleura dioica TaxID=34765 RepID=A0ABN7T9S0_OIKDI|nr:Oidioi.mRNA.OKI2018_I69.chr2.g7400.t1.cds [Oikopleura dioica]